MSRKRDVTVGKYYVNNKRKVAREVLGANDMTVKFNTYHMDTGNSCGSSSESTRPEFIRWADREATSSEMASLQSQEMEAQFRAPHSPNWEEPEQGMAIDPEALLLMQKNMINR